MTTIILRYCTISVVVHPFTVMQTKTKPKAPKPKPKPY